MKTTEEIRLEVVEMMCAIDRAILKSCGLIESPPFRTEEAYKRAVRSYHASRAIALEPLMRILEDLPPPRPPKIIRRNEL